jgi:hypothetical protein
MAMTDPRSTDMPAAAPDAPAGIAALVARIAASPIRPSAQGAASGAAWAPSGYDDADIRILDWIASHRRGRPARARRPDLAA